MRLPIAFLCMAFLAVSACATAPVATSPVSASCPPLKTYTDAQQLAVSAELLKLPDNDPLVGMIGDYGALRAAIRACELATPTP